MGQCKKSRPIYSSFFLFIVEEKQSNYGCIFDKEISSETNPYQACCCWTRFAIVVAFVLKEVAVYWHLGKVEDYLEKVLQLCRLSFSVVIERTMPVFLELFLYY